jgi:hypothetical protein
MKLPAYFSQSPIRRAAHSVLGNTPKSNKKTDETPGIFEEIQNNN